MALLPLKTNVLRFNNSVHEYTVVQDQKDIRFVHDQSIEEAKLLNRFQATIQP